ncbi:MAG: FAD-dependent monooxygenase [Caldimonas sp.]
MTAADPSARNYEVVFSEYFAYSRHAAVLPSSVTAGRDRVRHRVVIVGGGPTGLALALGLARYGIASVVLEADATVCTGSRAGAFTRRTLEIMDALGIADELVRTGLGWNKGWTYYGDAQIAETHIPDGPNERFPATLSQLQNAIEECMVTKAAAYGGLVDIRWHTRLDQLATGADGVTVSVEHPAGDYDLEADWLVACDGGRSTVRQAMGLTMQGERHAGRYAIVDIRIDTSDFPAGRRWWFDPPSNPGGTLIMFKKPGGMLRFDYQLRDDEPTDEAMEPDRVLDRVRRHLAMLGVDHPWEPVWLTLYRASALTLESYRHGRVLFAGDAAHLVPIFGVRGMNSAVEDAHNLAWKLALRLRGEAGDDLVDTYSEERVAAARENLRYASKGAEFMAPPSAPHRLMRDAVLSLSRQHPALTSLMSPRQHAANDYAGSSLHRASVSDTGFAAGPTPGRVLPECPLRLREGQAWRDGFVTELLGPRFTLIEFAAAGAGSSAMAEAVARLARRLPIASRLVAGRGTTRTDVAAAEDASGEFQRLYDATPGCAYLVRPDGHVLARWRAPTATGLDEALAHALHPAAKAPLPIDLPTEASMP